MLSHRYRLVRKYYQNFPLKNDMPQVVIMSSNNVQYFVRKRTISISYYTKDPTGVTL